MTTSFDDEDVYAVCSCEESTDPETLKWKPLLFGIIRNYLRLRMNITRENMSKELLGAYKYSKLPDKDLPEISGLLKVLDAGCKRNGLAYHLEKGPRDLQIEMVSNFEPYKIILPFEKVKLTLIIAPGEFQWILWNEKKEPKVNRDRVISFKESILAGTKKWLREDNRLNGAYNGP